MDDIFQENSLYLPFGLFLLAVYLVALVMWQCHLRLHGTGTTLRMAAPWAMVLALILQMTMYRNNGSVIFTELRTGCLVLYVSAWLLWLFSVIREGRRFRLLFLSYSLTGLMMVAAGVKTEITAWLCAGGRMSEHLVSAVWFMIFMFVMVLMLVSCVLTMLKATDGQTSLMTKLFWILALTVPTGVFVYAVLDVIPQLTYAFRDTDRVPADAVIADFSGNGDAQILAEVLPYFGVKPVVVPAGKESDIPGDSVIRYVFSVGKTDSPQDTAYLEELTAAAHHEPYVLRRVTLNDADSSGFAMRDLNSTLIEIRAGTGQCRLPDGSLSRRCLAEVIDTWVIPLYRPMNVFGNS